MEREHFSWIKTYSTSTPFHSPSRFAFSIAIVVAAALVRCPYSPSGGEINPNLRLFSSALQNCTSSTRITLQKWTSSRTVLIDLSSGIFFCEDDDFTLVEYVWRSLTPKLKPLKSCITGWKSFTTVQELPLKIWNPEMRLLGTIQTDNGFRRRSCRGSFKVHLLRNKESFLRVWSRLYLSLEYAAQRYKCDSVPVLIRYILCQKNCFAHRKRGPRRW